MLKSGVPWGVFLMQVLALGGIVVSGASLLLGGMDGGLAYVSYVLLGVCGIVLLTPLVTWQLPSSFQRAS